MSDIDKNMTGSEAVKREARDWLVRITSSEATKADLLALKAWREQSPLHATVFTEAYQFWKSIGPALEAVAQKNGVEAFAGAPRGPIMNRRAFLLGGAVAASAAAAVMVVHPPLGISLSGLSADYRTDTGEQRHLALADGVSVEMNTETSLNLRQSEAGKQIELLRGEAAVVASVLPQQPITVFAADGVVTASDATFDVLCLANAVRVTCLVGTVQVRSKERTVTLTQHQQLTYDHRTMAEAVAVDSAVATAWRQGRLVFHNEPLVHVIDEVNRYRRGRIILADSELGKRLVTAQFRLDRLDDVVTQMHEVFGARVRSLPGDIILLS